MKDRTLELETLLGPKNEALPPALDALMKLLHDEVGLYTLMEDRLMEKKMVLVQGNLAELSRIDQELVSLAQKTLEMEHTRLVLMTELNAAHLTLKDFLLTLPGNQARKFWPTRQRLVMLLENIRELSKENQDLLQIALKWISSAVESIARQIAPEGASYGNNGSKAKPQVHSGVGSILSSTVEHSV